MRTTAERVKYRHEFKYVLSSAELVMIQNRITNLLALDNHVAENGCYIIRSLYFDDYRNRCYFENEDGIDPREKFRIRIYNGSAEKISLECKRKERGKTLKTSCPLTKTQTLMLMEGRAIPDIANQHPVLRKLTIEMLMHRMRPVVIVEYKRIPYVYQQGNVRVTLDMNVSASTDIANFLKERITARPIMPLGKQLLEVKYDEFLPDYIYRNLQIENLQQTAHSKYYLCRKFSNRYGLCR